MCKKLFSREEIFGVLKNRKILLFSQNFHGWPKLVNFAWINFSRWPKIHILKGNLLKKFKLILVQFNLIECNFNNLSNNSEAVENFETFFQKLFLWLKNYCIFSEFISMVHKKTWYLAEFSFEICPKNRETVKISSCKNVWQ